MWTDGHCHPTDTPESLEKIGEMRCRMCLMSTRFDDLDLVAEQARLHRDKVIPAFGLHPWYSYLLSTELVSKYEHYARVLQPTPDETDEIFEWLPEPVLLSDHIERIKSLMIEFPNSLLGEIGLDKAFRLKIGTKLTRFRVSMEHQRQVLTAQLELAAKLHRSASLHGVQASQALLTTVEPFQDRLGSVCLHSYGGSAEFYSHHWRKLSIPVYISVASGINGKMGAEKLSIMLEAAEEELMLSESDYHSAGEKQLTLVKESVEIVAKRFNLSLEEAQARIEQNFAAFVSHRTVFT